MALWPANALPACISGNGWHRLRNAKNFTFWYEAFDCGFSMKILHNFNFFAKAQRSETK